MALLVRFLGLVGGFVSILDDHERGNGMLKSSAWLCVFEYTRFVSLKTGSGLLVERELSRA